MSEPGTRAPLQVDPDPRLARTLPAWAYTDAAHFGREVRAVFHRSWQYAGALAQLARTGDFVTADAAGQPVAIVRGEDGTLRGFHNVCRHRGHPLLAGAGCVQRVVCPYHAWTYGLDGRLRTARGAEGTPALADVALAPVRVEVLAGKFVFFNLDPDAEPLATFAAALEVAQGLDAGSVVLAMIPDTGERYLSTFLFEGVLEGSDDEWLAQLEAKADVA